MNPMEPPTTLAEAMALSKQIVEETVTDEDELPTLFMFTPDGEVLIAVIDVEGGGYEVARAVRQLVYVHDPKFAILQIEGWAPNPDLSKDDPDYIRISVGEITPSGLPPEKRVEVMIVSGESRDGQSQAYIWLIRRQPDGKRKLEPIEQPTETVSRFYPMFVAGEMFRKMRADTTSELHDLMQGMTDEQLYQLARKAAARILGEGRGGTTKSWEEEQHKIYRQNVSEVARRIQQQG